MIDLTQLKRLSLDEMRTLKGMLTVDRENLVENQLAFTETSQEKLFSYMKGLYDQHIQIVTDAIEQRVTEMNAHS